MIKKKIDCENCGFLGKLTFRDDQFVFSDIIICPVCGGDISEPEPEDEDEELDEE
jgi:hypothetical protein